MCIPMAGSIWEALKTSSWQESGTRNLREVVIRYGDKTLGYSLGETSDRQPMIEGRSIAYLNLQQCQNDLYL